MTTYYELLSDHTIGRSTNNLQIAQSLGLTLQTDKAIVYGCDGKRYFEGEQPELPELTYVQKRLNEYPPVGEQLDMIYWDMVNGTHLWQNKINEIKTKYPKV